MFLHAPTPAQISKKERPCPVHADWLILLSSKERVVTAVSGASRAGAHGGSAIWKADAVTEIAVEYDPVDGKWVNGKFIKPVPPQHQSRYNRTWMQWECASCDATAKTEFLLNMVACDPPEETRVHTGEAKWLCETGAGHVCDEPESRFEQLLAQMKELHDKKKADYTGTSGDLIWNYRNSAKLAGITTAQGMFARLCEKVIRISSVLSNGGATQVTDEKLTDTYFDLAVISLLCIIESEER